jgi:hypothetical protein
MLRDFTKDTFDIIIQAGQSNAEGASFGPVDNPYTPDGRVWYLNQNGTLTLAAEETWYNDVRGNFSLPFAREYIREGKLSDGRKLLILRCAVGGTGFSDGRWSMDGDLYPQMMDMIRTALALNPENRLVALLWHQGETDAARGASFEVHYKNLSDLLISVRTTFHTPDLPFVAGDFVRDWKDLNIQLCIPVVDAMRAVCRDCGRGGFAESDGLLSNRQELNYRPMNWGDDPIHFSRKSIYELGLRYYQVFSEITG